MKKKKTIIGALKWHLNKKEDETEGKYNKINKK